MALNLFKQRRRSEHGVWKRRALTMADEVDTADPDDDLASGRYTRHASSEEFLASLKKRA